MSKNKHQNGFTLIEIMLVTFVTGMVFTAVYSLFMTTVSYDTESRYEVIAAGLAQEGVEIVRNIRDENVLIGSPNLIETGISATCYPFINTSGIANCAGLSSSIGFHNTRNRYENCPGASCDSNYETTPFTRSCARTTVAAGENIEVTCTVSWTSLANNTTRSVSAKSVLTDWE